MLKTFQPSSAQLGKYIEVFYVFSGDQPREFSYFAFPHVNTAISFFKGVKLTRGSFEVTIENDQAAPDQSHVEILGKYTQPFFVHFKGNVEEIAIVFKPFGVNQFLRGDLIRYAPDYTQALADQTWHSFADLLFSVSDTSTRMALLEDFLLSVFREVQNNMITRALELLSDTETDLSIESIAVMHALSVKTFQRQFLKQITCTPSEYKRIARFRHVLQNRILSEEVKSLTELTYESNYYDQSYFIREFRKLTRLNPKKFFEAVTVLDKKKIIWEIK